jgi:hypothetical protein
MAQRNIGGSEVQGETRWNFSTTGRPGYMGESRYRIKVIYQRAKILGCHKQEWKQEERSCCKGGCQEERIQVTISEIGDRVIIRTGYSKNKKILMKNNIAVMNIMGTGYSGTSEDRIQEEYQMNSIQVKCHRGMIQGELR